VSESTCSASATFNCSEEGKKYVGGYLAHAFQQKYPEFGDKTCDLSSFEKNNNPWICALSRGGLTAPSKFLMDKINQFEDIFNQIHGSSINSKPQIIKTTIKLISHHFPTFPVEVITKYARTRTFLRVKFLNHNLKCEAEATRARNAAKKRHFVN
jgi:hypothetical protein